MNTNNNMRPPKISFIQILIDDVEFAGFSVPIDLMPTTVGIGTSTRRARLVADRGELAMREYIDTMFMEEGCDEM